MQTLQVGYSKLDERLKKLIDDYAVVQCTAE